MVGAVTAPVGSGEWWSTFTTSPAIAGIAAVVAALIALASAGLRLRAEKRMARDAHARAERAAELARIAALEDRDLAAWWEQYRWTYDRLPTLDPKDATRALGALGDAAPTAVGVTLVDVALSTYADVGRSRAGGDSDG